MTIARLKGIVEEAGAEGVILDVHGVGYLLLLSGRSRAALPAVGEGAVLLVETQIREDAVTLFGFIDREERDWFRLLTTVQGVGGKVALNILSVLDPAPLAQAIVLQDKAALARAEGVGPKLAIRIVTELKDKAAQASFIPVSIERGKAGPAKPAGDVGAAAEAVSALENLGYRRPEALEAVTLALRKSGKTDTALLIRAALQEMALKKEGAR